MEYTYPVLGARNRYGDLKTARSYGCITLPLAHGAYAPLKLATIFHGCDVSARARRCIRPEAADCDKVYELHSQLHAVLPENQPPSHVIIAYSSNTLSSFNSSSFINKEA